MKVWTMKLNNENQCEQTTKVPNITEDIYIKIKQRTTTKKTKKQTNKKSISHTGQRLCAWESYTEVVEPTSFKMSIYLLSVVRISKKHSKILPNILPKSK